MPKNQSTAAKKARAAARDGAKYTAALTAVADPANKVICQECGWTASMVCPECSKGCGCETGCTGWRHLEESEVLQYTYGGGHECHECGADVAAGYRCDCASYLCGECGGDTRHGYGCHCEEG